MDDIKINVERVQAQIADACARVNRDPGEVTLVAVSKTRPSADVLAAVEAGVQHFGENRVEEASNKIPAIHALVTWHMIGHIQSRKARHIPDLFQVVHSVDSVKLAEKLSQQALDSGGLDVLLQMNVSGEESKSGFAAYHWRQARDGLWQHIRQVLALPGLRVQGLMTIAPIVARIEDVRPLFAELAALRAALAEDFEVSLPELSMGMTDDFPVAVEEGATMVRIGRAIFGERN
jgi:PLP dependent protein